MNNKAIFLILILTFSFLSCSRELEASLDLIYNFENKSSKDVYIIVETNIETKGDFTFSEQEIQLHFKATRKVELGAFEIASGHVRLVDIKVIKFNIYNLTDTTSYQFTVGTNKEAIDELFFEKDNTFINDAGVRVVEENDFSLTENFLSSLNQKDYTMLEQFKEYYNQ